MKSCLNTILVIILTPLLFVAILSTTITNLVFDENTYVKLFDDNSIKEDLANAAVVIIRDHVVADKIGLNSFLQNDRTETLIKQYVFDRKLQQSYMENAIGLVSYMNGKIPEINQSSKTAITEEDVKALKQIVVELYSDYYTELKKCNNDQEYQNKVNSSEVPNCRPPSLTISDVIANVREAVDKAISYQTVADYVSGKIPLTSEVTYRMKNIRDGYKLFKDNILTVWVIIGVLILLLIIINSIGGLNFPGPLSVVAFNVSIFLAIVGGLLHIASNALSIRGIDLNLSNEYGLDTTTKFAALITSLAHNLLAQLYSNLYLCAGVLFAISVILFILKFVLRAHSSSRTILRKEYYIPAYSKAKQSMPRADSKSPELAPSSINEQNTRDQSNSQNPNPTRAEPQSYLRKESEDTSSQNTPKKIM
jgi:hypothetical protein